MDHTEPSGKVFPFMVASHFSLLESDRANLYDTWPEVSQEPSDARCVQVLCFSYVLVKLSYLFISFQKHPSSSKSLAANSTCPLKSHLFHPGRRSFKNDTAHG